MRSWNVVVLSALSVCATARVVHAQPTSTSTTPADQKAVGARVLDLRTLLRRVQANNEALKAARGNIEVAEGEVQRAWTGWQPQVNAVGSLTFNSVEAEFSPGDLITGVAGALGLPPPPAEALPPPVVIQPHVQLGAALSFSQTLFNITVLRAPGVARAARVAASARVDAVEDELLFNAASLYAALGGLQSLQAAAERAAKVAEARVQNARVQLEAGTTTQLVLLRAETDLAEAEGQKQTLLARRNGMLANLRALIAADDEEIDVEPKRITEYMTTSSSTYEQRATVVASIREYEAAEKAIGLTNMNWLPSLTADATLRWSNAAGFADNLVGAATLNLVIPLYDSGVRYAETRIAEARASQARHAMEQERLNARAYFEDAQATLAGARTALVQAEAQLKLATAAVKQTENLYAQGLATNLELTDADARRFSADQLVSQRQLEVDIAALRTYYASGGTLRGRE